MIQSTQQLPETEIGIHKIKKIKPKNYQNVQYLDFMNSTQEVCNTENTASELKQKKSQNQIDHVEEHVQSSDKNDTDPIWTKSEQKMLFTLHQTIGNKWAQIARIIPGKTINSVKNKFYCTLRRGHKNLNRFISQRKDKNKYKKVKPNVLPKLFEAIGDYSEGNAGAQNQLLLMSVKIKEGLIESSDDAFNVVENQNEILIIIQNLNIFNKLYKKRRSSKQSRYLTKKSSKAQKIHSSSNIQIPINSMEYKIIYQRVQNQKQVKVENSLVNKINIQNIFIGDDGDDYQEEHSEENDSCELMVGSYYKNQMLMFQNMYDPTDEIAAQINSGRVSILNSPGIGFMSGAYQQQFEICELLSLKNVGGQCFDFL